MVHEVSHRLRSCKSLRRSLCNNTSVTNVKNSNNYLYRQRGRKKENFINDFLISNLNFAGKNISFFFLTNYFLPEVVQRHVFYSLCQISQLLVQESYQIERRHAVVHFQRFLQHRKYLHTFTVSNVAIHQRIVNYLQFPRLLVPHCIHFQHHILVAIPQNRLTIRRNEFHAFLIPVTFSHRLSFLIDHIQHLHHFFQYHIIFCTSSGFEEKLFRAFDMIASPFFDQIVQQIEIQSCFGIDSSKNFTLMPFPEMRK